MTPLFRASTQVQLAAYGDQFARLVAGMLIFATGFFFELLEYKEATTHSGHVYFFGCWMLLGVCIAFGAYVFPVAQKIMVFVGPYLPGGQRAGDKIIDKMQLPPPETKP